MAHADNNGPRYFTKYRCLGCVTDRKWFGRVLARYGISNWDLTRWAARESFWYYVSKTATKRRITWRIVGTGTDLRRMNLRRTKPWKTYRTAPGATAL